MSFLTISCVPKVDKTADLAKKIMSDQSMKKVEDMARDLMKKGFGISITTLFL